MSDLVQRFSNNPLLHPGQITPSAPGLEIACLLNPGAFRFQGKSWILIRVAERPLPQPGRIATAILQDGQTTPVYFDESDPALDRTDPRVYQHNGVPYLSTLSHLRLWCSDDGIHFRDSGLPPLVGEGEQETYGIEDCRVSTMADGTYILTYTAVSANGYGIGLRTTRDWKAFTHYGLVIPPANKDCAVFEEKINGQYACLHRPSGVIVGGHYIWLGWSPDLHHWGRNTCIARTRPGLWDSARIGAGAAPIRTEKGWLAIYHGADAQHRYSLGALLLDLDDPTRVLARSAKPLMEPDADYEKQGFFGNVVFTNGHVVDGDKITMYYGASDTVICGATLSIAAILRTLVS